VIFWIPCLLVFIAAAIDLRKREVPDEIPLYLLAWTVGVTAGRWQASAWVSLALGLALGLVVAVALFALGGFGGGDAKLIAALGALVGPKPLLTLLFYVAVAGGVLGLVAKLRSQRDLPYAPAIALGFLAFLIGRWPSG